MLLIIKYSIIKIKERMIKMKEKFIWIEIYNKITYKLLYYKDNRKVLVDFIHEILEELSLFNEKGEADCNLDKYQN